MADASRSDAPARRVTLYPGETVADAARKAIAFGVESMTLNQAAAENGDAEPLHQLRVASRRLREVLPVLQLDARVAHKVGKRLRRAFIRNPHDIDACHGLK